MRGCCPFRAGGAIFAFGCGGVQNGTSGQGGDVTPPVVPHRASLGRDNLAVASN